ncbi:MAG: molybdopterin-dependent oxidoreductase, partial [Pseudomonadota bacterium]|nr:molybdopterin-dependent oxidoreductase [Pseudomonadota bacterium]
MTDQAKKLISGTHWGVFRPVMADGRMVAAQPFENDRDPSPMLRSLPQQLDHPTRVREPMIRKGWLARREGSDRAGRGREPFVAVSWEKALDLLAAEQQRVIAAKGNSAIYGGSYGWASAGRLHSATGLLKRYLGLTGGFTDSVGTYSFAAGGVILPHVIGRAGAASSWSSLVGETQLFVAFGGVPLKNAQIT